MSKDFEDFRAYALANWEEISREESARNREFLNPTGDADLAIPSVASVIVSFTLIHLYHDWLVSLTNTEEH